jgi:hypothetical protein
MVFGLVGMCSTYLKENKSCVCHQGRSGSDPLEHLFCKVRGKNSNPNEQQARESISTLGYGNHTSHLFSRSGGQNAAKAGIEASDYFTDFR